MNPKGQSLKSSLRERAEEAQRQIDISNMILLSHVLLFQNGIWTKPTRNQAKHHRNVPL